MNDYTKIADELKTYSRGLEGQSYIGDLTLRASQAIQDLMKRVEELEKERECMIDDGR